MRVANRARPCFPVDSAPQCRVESRLLKDIVFFPVAILLALLMVGGAMQVGAGVPLCGPVGGANGPEDYSIAIIQGRDLCRMEAVYGHELTQSAPEKPQNTLRILAEPDALRNDVEASAHFKLGPDLETVYAGQILRVTIRAQPSPERGALAFEFNYSTGKAGDTGWHRFYLEPGWKDYTHTIEIPNKLLESTVALDYFAIRPVIAEKPRAIEVEKITFERLGRWDGTG